MPTRTPHKLTLNAANVAWTNMPIALTELFGTVHRRARVDLTDCDKVRLTVRVSTQGAAASTLKAQYSTDEAAWVDLTGTVSLAAVGTVGSAWADVPAGARGDVVVRVVGVGDGVADPVLGTVLLEAR